MTDHYANLPSGTGLTLVDVYNSRTPDGQRGGCPHMHLACTELYFTVAGTGAVEFLSDTDGFQRMPLRPGKVVYFSPGVIHRLINESGDLQVLVLMENSGLPEMGDAVLTFPSEHMTSPEAYTAALTVRDKDAYRPTLHTPAATVEEAETMRDLAVQGFQLLVTAFNESPEEGRRALRAFHSQAVALANPLTDEWQRIIHNGTATAFEQTGSRLRAIAHLDNAYLRDGRVTDIALPDRQHPCLSMCGLMWPYLPDHISFETLSGLKDMPGA